MERILIIQTAFIGDAILTLPMIQKLKEFFPGCKLDVLTIPATASIFPASPFVDNVLTIDKKGKHKSFFALLKFINELKKNNYSKIYSPHRSFRSSFIVFMLGVKESFGFSNSSLKFVYKKLIEYVPSHHEVQRDLELIGFDGKNSSWKILPEVKVTDEEKEKINSYFANLKINLQFSAIAPGSVWNTKKYPQEYYDELVKYFNEKNYYSIIIGSETDKELCENIAEKFPGSASSAAGLFNINETIELLRRVKILISNDSAPTHMGMCADIPVLTLFCSTIPGFGFYPYNDKSKFLSYDDLICKPCGIHGFNECPIKTFECGWKLSPQVVISKIEEMLNDQHKELRVNQHR
jgi:heptosyltransferase-2